MSDAKPQAPQGDALAYWSRLAKQTNTSKGFVVRESYILQNRSEATDKIVSQTEGKILVNRAFNSMITPPCRIGANGEKIPSEPLPFVSFFTTEPTECMPGYYKRCELETGHIFFTDLWSKLLLQKIGLGKFSPLQIEIPSDEGTPMNAIVVLFIDSAKMPPNYEEQFEKVIHEVEALYADAAKYYLESCLKMAETQQILDSLNMKREDVERVLEDKLSPAAISEFHAKSKLHEKLVGAISEQIADDAYDEYSVFDPSGNGDNDTTASYPFPVSLIDEKLYFGVNQKRIPSSRVMEQLRLTGTPTALLTLEG